ncbi:MAG: pantoate--beta-alanine ligase [Pseudomonadota bacterium]|nr:pantoate--beta-alanine ligase [Pseudomonadota bacterium]
MTQNDQGPPRSIAVAHTIAEARAALAESVAAGRSIGLVPTMGNLHPGHLTLVQRALEDCDQVVVSLFVNPTQFGPKEDFARYPRTLEQDLKHLMDAGAHLAFVPSVDTMYPLGTANTIRVGTPAAADILCGAARPGHFTGVTTVVTKLFNIVRPQRAYFGEKDYQQLTILRLLVQDLHFPVSIIAVPTCREPDGLAMSSRNQYLDGEQRRRASEIPRALATAAEQIGEGALEHAAIAESGKQALRDAGFDVDYFEIRRAEDLGVPDANHRNLVVLTAARIGQVRLIDNLRIEV